MSLSVERPSFDGLEALLMHGTTETVAIKLGGSTGPFSRGVSPRSLRGKLFRSHFLRGQTFGKLIYKEMLFLKQKQHTNLFDLEQTCAHISLKKNIYERTYAQNILLSTSIYKDIQNILATYIPHIFSSKELIYACSRFCAKITYVRIQSIFATKNYIRTFKVFY